MTPLERSARIDWTLRRRYFAVSYSANARKFKARHRLPLLILMLDALDRNEALSDLDLLAEQSESSVKQTLKSLQIAESLGYIKLLPSHTGTVRAEILIEPNETL